MRTRILSDLHLGHSASRLTDPAMLDAVLEGVDQLVLAGDVWQQRGAREPREKGKRLFESLRERIAKRGISLEVLRGNHDPDSGRGVAWLADRAILVTHGDAVYDEGTPWSADLGRYRKEVAAIIADYAKRSGSAEACSERARRIAHTLRALPLPNLPPPLNFLATAMWPPSRPLEMVRVWRGMGRAGLDFLERSGEGASVLVCGHFHRAGIWERDGCLMINTGSFMPGSQPWAVDVHGAKLTARRLVLNAGAFEPGEVTGRWILRP